MDDLADGICDDLSRKRIFDRYDIALDGCVDLGILKGEVAGLRGAIYQFEPLTVAKRLGTDDVAVDECDVFRIPREIFALHHAVADGDVLRVPKSILGVEGRIRDLDVFGVLEGIFSVESEIIKLDIAALEEEILACDLGVLDMYAAASPTEFGGRCGAVLEAHILAFAHSLYVKDLAILELSVFAIPKRRADAFVELALAQREIGAMPHRITQAEIATKHVDADALFERGFAVLCSFKIASDNVGVAEAVKRALLACGYVFIKFSFSHFQIPSNPAAFVPHIFFKSSGSILKDLKKPSVLVGSSQGASLPKRTLSAP